MAASTKPIAMIYLLPGDVGETAMVARIFQVGLPDEVALQRLGAAVVLLSEMIPPQFLDALGQQALLINSSGEAFFHLREKIDELRGAGNASVPFRPPA
jgi:hypothetical protein